MAFEVPLRVFRPTSVLQWERRRWRWPPTTAGTFTGVVPLALCQAWGAGPYPGKKGNPSQVSHCGLESSSHQHQAEKAAAAQGSPPWGRRVTLVGGSRGETGVQRRNRLLKMEILTNLLGAAGETGGRWMEVKVARHHCSFG